MHLVWKSIVTLLLFGYDLDSFNRWAHYYNKSYASIGCTGSNISTEFLNWRENTRYVNEHNKHHSDFLLEVNGFADIREDWSIRRGHNKHMSRRTFEPPTEKKALLGVPRAVDWRVRDLVTGIKNQQQCGSCWAFSAVGSMEGQHARNTGTLVSLSESQIVDCDVNGTDQGCGGGLMDGAFKYVIKQGGIESEKAYPYIPEDDPCVFNKKKVAATFSSYKDVTGGETGLKEAVAHVGPVSVAIDASNPSFQFYKTGVYYEPDCSSTQLDHGVLVVGYNTTSNGTDYWIVKNSWGESWGENGYIRMARNRDNNCGIATQPSYPVV